METPRTWLLITLAMLGLTLAVWALVPLGVFMAFVGLLVSVALGILLRLLFASDETTRQPELLEILLTLAGDPELADIHQSLAESFRQLSSQRDPVFRRLALSRLQSILADCRLLGRGAIEFTSTESWRVVYEELLRSPGLHLYRSVAYIESAHYWQDGPGRQSTQLNFELHDTDVITIERTAIIADHLWPPNELFPVEPLHSWLQEHHRYGIWLRLVRESALESDVDLLGDFGIYGSRAVGIQTADPAGRTIRFTLQFDFDKVQQAEALWNRLKVYSVSYADLLDQQH